MVGMPREILKIGTKLTNHKGVYTILGDNGLKSGNKKYLIHCSICSEDAELFPEIWSRKGDLMAGKLSCLCSGRFSFSKEQYEILCKRRATETNSEFIGFKSDEKVTGNSYVIFRDAAGVIVDNITVRYFLNKYTEGKYLFRYDDEYYTNKLQHLFHEGTKIKRTENNTTFKVFCPVCAESPLCKAGITSPWFKSTYQNMVKGNRPCFCSGHYFYSEEEYKFLIKYKLIGVGTFNKILKPFNGNKTKFEWQCDCGYIHTQFIRDFFSGRRCPSCTSYGFNPDKPATLYVVRWAGNNTSFIKVGITNRDPLIRFDEQQKASTCRIVDYKLYQFELGKDADLLEDILLANFPRINISLDRFDDGKTELFDIDQYDEILKVIENYECRNN